MLIMTINKTCYIMLKDKKQHVVGLAYDSCEKYFNTLWLDTEDIR